MDPADSPTPGLSPERQAAFAALQARFAAGLPARWAAIEAAVDATERTLHLHRLAGAAGSYGLAELSALAREAEYLAQDAPSADLAASLARLHTLITALAPT